MTVAELRKALYRQPGHREVRLVFHGYERTSMNQPIAIAYEGANDDFLIIVEENRAEKRAHVRVDYSQAMRAAGFPL